MNTKLDIHLIFPLDEYTKPEFERLVKYCGSIGDVEHNFSVEFSCGDGKYYGDFYRSSPNGHCLQAVVSDEELEKYDGKTCTDTPPRLVPIKMSHVEEPLKANKIYRFTIKYVPKTKEEIYYINDKERGRKKVDCMKIDRKELFKLYMEEVEHIAEVCDWVTHFGPEEIVNMIAHILENNPNLFETDK